MVIYSMEIRYDRTRSDRVKYSQAVNRLLEKGLVENNMSVMWEFVRDITEKRIEIDVDNTRDPWFTGAQNADKVHVFKERTIWLTDKGREELEKRREWIGVRMD